MIQSKRAKWTIRFSLLTLLIFVVTVFAILIFAGKKHINPNTAKELLQTMTSEELERVFGPADQVLIKTSGKQMTWIFDEDSLFNTSQFQVTVGFDD